MPLPFSDQYLSKFRILAPKFRKIPNCPAWPPALCKGILDAGWITDYTKIMKSISGVDTTKLALWAVLLFMVLVAGMAILGSGPS